MSVPEKKTNFGNCTDIFAPGVNILSASIGFRNNFATGTGTSMATPPVASLIAYFLFLQPTSDSAYSVAAIIPKKMKEYIIPNTS